MHIQFYRTSKRFNQAKLDTARVKDSNYATSTLCERKQQLELGNVTSLETMNNSLNLIEELKSLNAFVSVEPAEQLRDLASSHDLPGSSSILRGLPIAVKDNFNVANKPTTCASQVLKGYKATYTATVCQRLLDAGGIIVGSTNMDEFGMGSFNTFSAYGPARHPFLLNEQGEHAFVSGGSSGGSAVAVASQQVYAALGSDTGGSVRLPAAWCHIYGLKPTYGLCSRYGLVAYASSLDTPGLLARSVDDCALLLNIIGGPDSNDATCSTREKEDYATYNNYAKSLADVTIGVPVEYNTTELPEDIREMWFAAVSDLKSKGATIKNVSLPHTKYALSAYYIIACAEASSNLARYDGVRFGHRTTEKVANFADLITKSRDEGFGEEVKRRILLGTFVLSHSAYEDYFLKAAKIRRLVSQDFVAAFRDVDVLLTPTSTGPPPRIDQRYSNPTEAYLNDIMTIPSNLAGVPALSVPALTRGTKQPRGLQLIGKRFNERALFYVASQLENE